MLIGLLTAVAASVCYGTGSVLQAVGSRRSAQNHAAATARTPYGGPSLSSTAKAAMTWEFMVGTVLDFVGFALGALAARLLPLFLSQTVISANLIITAVLSVRLLGILLTRAEWTSIGVVCVALVLLATAAGEEGSAHGIPISTHWWLLVISLALMAGGTLAVRLLGPRAAVLAGLLSGLGFGALGVGVRVLEGLAPFDPAAMLTDPALYAIVTAGAGGMYLHTVALQIGSVNGATAALVVGETVLPGAIGVLWLGDASRAGLIWMAVLGFVLAVSGSVAVAWFGGREAHLEEEQPPEAAALAPTR